MLEALLPTLVTVEQANKLFDLMPGMEFCSYDQPSGFRYYFASLLFADFYFVFNLNTM